MGIIKSTKDQLRQARRENERLRAEYAKLEANQDYIAMMADVDIPDEEESDDE